MGCCYGLVLMVVRPTTITSILAKQFVWIGAVHDEHLTTQQEMYVPVFPRARGRISLVGKVPLPIGARIITLKLVTNTRMRPNSAGRSRTSMAVLKVQVVQVVIFINVSPVDFMEMTDGMKFFLVMLRSIFLFTGPTVPQNHIRVESRVKKCTMRQITGTIRAFRKM